MNKKQLFLLLFINVLIASSFFVKNIGVGYSQLSSDMHNIVPMCMKLDNPNLYPNDLYLTDIDNFKFYTPFFIESLRFIASFTDYNYVQATNILLFFSSLFFGISWFFLLFKVLRERFWIALLLSVFMRGIVWLPNGEIWGISDLWTMMPRTVYAALLPLPFLLLLKHKSYLLNLACFLIGFIFNFHPISGLGGILIFVLLVASFWWFKYKRYTLKQVTFGGLLLIVGMAPFILTYFGKTDTAVLYDLKAYEMAFDAKISSNYQNPNLVFRTWLKFKFLFFLIPLLVFAGYTFSTSHPYKKQAIILITISAGLFFLPVSTIYLEQLVNTTFDINLRMSFQLVRIQKMAILPAYFAIGFLILLLVEAYGNFNKYLIYVFSGYLTLLIFSHNRIFNKTPFLGDDLSRSILPGFSEVVKPISSRKTDFDKIADYIYKNTPNTAVFYSNYRLRSAAQRSVQLDVKGANILVEGNPQKLIKWFRARRKITKATNEEQLVALLNENNIDYILSKKKWHSITLLKSINKWNLYQIEAKENPE